jgi:hypothetical protein
MTNILELYNESTLLMLSLCLIPLDNIVNDSDIRYNIGWTMVAITLLFLLLNFLVMIYGIMKKVMKIIKKKII